MAIRLPERISSLESEASIGLYLLTRGSSFNHWARGFQLVAEDKGVWDLFSSEEAPRGYSNHVQSFILDNTLRLLKKWVDPKIRYHLRTVSSPRDAWNLLLEEYKIDDDLTRGFAIKKLQLLERKECTGMEDYVDKHFSLREDFIYAGGKISDSEMFAFMHAGLLSYYNRTGARLKLLNIFTQAGLGTKTSKDTDDPPTAKRLHRLGGELLLFELTEMLLQCQKMRQSLIPVQSPDFTPAKDFMSLRLSHQ